jgi:hypothetical protein
MAGVCGSQITIPKYEDEATMAAKIRQAIAFTGTFENDGRVNLDACKNLPEKVDLFENADRRQNFDHRIKP